MFEIKYFEDLNVGDKSISSARTVTEADIVNFAGLSNNYNTIHIDREFAQQTPYKQRIAHGILVLSIGSGLFTNSDLNISMRKNVIALMEIKCRFLKPVFIGDTIHVEAVITEKKETKKSDRGIVIMERTICNQKDEAVQKLDAILMVRRRAANK